MRNSFALKQGKADMQTLAIVGASLAGISAARAQGFA